MAWPVSKAATILRRGILALIGTECVYTRYPCESISIFVLRCTCSRSKTSLDKSQ